MAAFLPLKYLISLKNFLTELQTETGDLYQVHISKYGDMSGGLTVNAFKDNTWALVIYDMNPDFEELNGSYASLEEVRQRITELNSNDKWADIKTVITDGEVKQIGKCKQCHSYNENIPHKCPNYISSDVCQNCSKWFKSKWDSIDISDSTPEIMK
jgi:hypothetical protein